MKKLYLCLLVLASIILASCGGKSPLKISKKEILKQCNKNLVETGQDSSVVTVDAGYYEQNNENERLKLEKLKAAGIIDYSVERFAWWDKSTVKKTVPYKVTVNTWWGPTTETRYTTKWVTEYDFQEHFMVNVSLTEKTQKYALNHRPMPKMRLKEDKAFRQPVYEADKYPENQVTSLSENWPEIPHPLADETYKKCKAILAEVSAMLDQVTDNAYAKPEQKLNTLDKEDNYYCMTSVQKDDINSGRDKLEKRIDVLKGNEAFAKQKKIVEDAMAMLEKAKVCRDLDKATNKMNGIYSVANEEKMSQSQEAEISSMVKEFKNQVNGLSEEFGCNIEEPEEYEFQEDYELPDDDEMNPQEAAYRNAKEKESRVAAILFAYVKKAVVARNIRLSQGENGTTATADVIYELRKVTDAERVFNRSLNKKRVKGEVTFTYYCDKGWVINGAEINNDEENGVVFKNTNPATINMSGNMGSDNAVCMSLVIAPDGSVTGAYYYKKNGPGALLYLKGEKDGSDITLTEYNVKGRKTGTYQGTYSSNWYRGEFESYKGKTYSFDLQEDQGMAPIDFSGFDFDVF